VNGLLPGDALDVARGTRVRVTAEALGHPEHVPLASLEIVGHGRVLARADGRGESRLTASVEIPIERGLWIAARAAAGTAQAAHTTPVYVVVNGGSFANTDKLGAHLDTAERYLREIEAELDAPAKNLDAQASRHRAQLERQIAEARKEIERRRAAR
jgi:hypothetical protein